MWHMSHTNTGITENDSGVWIIIKIMYVGQNAIDCKSLQMTWKAPCYKTLFYCYC